MKKYRPPTGQKRLGDFFDGMKKEQFWCIFCKEYSEIELEVQSGRDMLVLFTCGHKDLKENARRLTGYHREDLREKK